MPKVKHDHTRAHPLPSVIPQSQGTNTGAQSQAHPAAGRGCPCWSWGHIPKSLSTEGACRALIPPGEPPCCHHKPKPDPKHQGGGTNPPEHHPSPARNKLLGALGKAHTAMGSTAQPLQQLFCPHSLGKAQTQPSPAQPSPPSSSPVPRTFVQLTAHQVLASSQKQDPKQVLRFTGQGEGKERR